jgi:hypothetical protein
MWHFFISVIVLVETDGWSWGSNVGQNTVHLLMYDGGDLLRIWYTLGLYLGSMGTRLSILSLSRHLVWVRISGFLMHF